MTNMQICLECMQQRLRRDVHKLESLQTIAQERAREAEAVSERVIDNWQEFARGRAIQKEQLMHILYHKDFLFPVEMKAKLQSFQVSNMDCKRAMRKMEARSHKRLYQLALDNLRMNTWLLNIISRLKGQYKKAKNSVPACCFRFLAVVKNIAMLGWDLDRDIFYYIVERTITSPKEEHCHPMVYRTLKAARDAVRIGPEAYLKYLEDREIPACPELLVHIRELRNRKKGKRERLRTFSNFSTASGGVDTPPAADDILAISGVDSGAWEENYDDESAL